MLALSWAAERTGQLLLVASLAQFWAIPSLIWLRTAYTAESSKWLTWGMLTLLISKPSRTSLKEYTVLDIHPQRLTFLAL